MRCLVGLRVDCFHRCRYDSHFGSDAITTAAAARINRIDSYRETIKLMVCFNFDFLLAVLAYCLPTGVRGIRLIENCAISGFHQFWFANLSFRNQVL